ncbi:hypothetical protein niasHT_035017 [Heterodera trifolii]|uniref:Uncharacterized protein n=1 Tax=Heterodera trifolii TaxID=157864 RepID=A0ABD2IU62_9BILA
MGNEGSKQNQHQHQHNANNNSGSSSSANKLGNKKVSRRMSMGAGIPPKTPTIRVGGSTGFLDVNNENCETTAGDGDSPRLSLSIDQLSARSRSGSQASGSQSPNKMPQKQRRCSLTVKYRQLIQGCFNNPHENIGVRILKRSAEKRKDFGRFYISIGAEHCARIADILKQLLKKSVANIYGGDEELQSLANEFGSRFVDLRLLGFKADFFAVLADSTTMECVLLDAAVHPANVTLNAFSQFITMLFSAVRDGFYTEMRRLRRTSNSFTINPNAPNTMMKKLSVDDNIKVSRALQGARSISPSPELETCQKSAQSSPIGHGSQESITDHQPQQNNNNGTNSRKISPESLQAKEEIRLLTAEFMGRAMVVGGKECQRD